MEWQTVRSEEDIVRLMGTYGGFHDACLVSLGYTSGAFVSSDLGMGFGTCEERELCMTFQRQWRPVALELRFQGVRAFHIAGWQENYFCDIFDCCLAFHRGLIPGRDEPLILWADNGGFDPTRPPQERLLAEPADSYVVADALQWRLLPE